MTLWFSGLRQLVHFPEWGNSLLPGQPSSMKAARKRRKGRRSPGQTPSRLCLEPLEDRRLLAVAPHQLTELPDGLATLTGLTVFSFAGNRVCGPLSSAVAQWLGSVEFWSGIDFTDAPVWQSETGQNCP